MICFRGGLCVCVSVRLCAKYLKQCGRISTILSRKNGRVPGTHGLVLDRIRIIFQNSSTLFTTDVEHHNKL